jgi:hypothetical protein
MVTEVLWMFNSDFHLVSNWAYKFTQVKHGDGSRACFLSTRNTKSSSFRSRSIFRSRPTPPQPFKPSIRSSNVSPFTHSITNISIPLLFHHIFLSWLTKKQQNRPSASSQNVKIGMSIYLLIKQDPLGQTILD